MILIFLIVYVIPLIFNFIYLRYFDKDIQTMKDLLDYLWVCITPFVNIFAGLILTTELILKCMPKNKIKTRWNNFLNIKFNK